MHILLNRRSWLGRYKSEKLIREYFLVGTEIFTAVLGNNYYGEATLFVITNDDKKLRKVLIDHGDLLHKSSYSIRNLRKALQLVIETNPQVLDSVNS